MKTSEALRMIVASLAVALFSCSPSVNIHKEYFVEWEALPSEVVSITGTHTINEVTFWVANDSVYVLEGGELSEVQPVRDRQWIGGNKLRIAVSDSIRVWR